MPRPSRALGRRGFAPVLAGILRQVDRRNVPNGPDPQDGRAPGTVFLAVDDWHVSRVVRLDLDGEPVEVCRAAAAAALRLLADALLPAAEPDLVTGDLGGRDTA
jgi:hypothetical protein